VSWMGCRTPPQLLPKFKLSKIYTNPLAPRTLQNYARLYIFATFCPRLRLMRVHCVHILLSFLLWTCFTITHHPDEAQRILEFWSIICLLLCFEICGRFNGYILFLSTSNPNF
jgi:hypothetical protein